jgi:hypothetical protein
MDYTSFLFSNLLREFNKSYDELPYDEMYDKHIALLLEYEKSKFNVDDKTEYQCIVDFMEWREVSNIKF